MFYWISAGVLLLVGVFAFLAEDKIGWVAVVAGCGIVLYRLTSKEDQNSGA